jgi:hypothetical protein
MRVVVCEAPLEVRVERARRRAAAGGGVSDAGPEVVRSLEEEPVELPVSPGRRLVVATTGPRAEAAERVAAWLDGGDAHTLARRRLGP